MSAIADFSVAVLDCQRCYRHFIENYVVVALHSEQVACPHCGAHYLAPGDASSDALQESAPTRHGHRRRSGLHALAPNRRKLH